MRQLASRLEGAVAKAQRRRLALLRKGWANWARAATCGTAAAAFRYVRPAGTAKPVVVRGEGGLDTSRPIELRRAA